MAMEVPDPRRGRAVGKGITSGDGQIAGFEEKPKPPRLEEMTLEEVERVVIQKALARFDGNVSHAARALGLSRSALYRRLGAHGL